MCIRDSITGGLKYNAIPRNAEAVVGISKADQPVLEEVLQHFGRIFSDGYRAVSYTQLDVYKRQGVFL